jgi:hypothetical protein
MNNLFKDGYYIGKNTELFSDLSIFKDYCLKTNELANDKDNFRYRFNYEHPIPYEMLIRLDEISAREQFVRDNHLNTFQRWWQYSGNELISMKNYFRKVVTDFINKNYGDFGELVHMDDVTLFENGDFINEHKDGYNEGRICVFLIYLSDSQTYNDGGGKLIIKNNDVIAEVYPINENFTILDFTQNNVTHEVTPIKNDFKRLTYINFISKK